MGYQTRGCDPLTVTPEWIEQRSQRTKSGCWIWCMCTHQQGYGLAGNINGSTRAHRISWTIFNGPIPVGLNVLHHCDVPACVNPDHLFLGTHQDNARDRTTKGRGARGKNHGNAKLNEQKVRAIRASPLPKRRLARKYGVDPALIRNIQQHKIWKHVP